MENETNTNVSENTESEQTVETSNETTENQTAEEFELKVNGETEKVNRDDVISLAQKGKDYDRIRTGYDFLKEQAKSSGYSDIQSYIEATKKSHTIPNVELSSAELSDLNEKKLSYIKSMQDEGYTGTFVEDMANIRFDKEKDKLLNGKRETAKREMEYQTKLENASKMSEPLKKQLEDSQKQLAELQAKIKAIEGNSKVDSASVGSLKSTTANEKGFVTSEEYDKLPRKEQLALVKSGKIFEYMKKWNKK